jgi:hypothetical protein
MSQTDPQVTMFNTLDTSVQINLNNRPAGNPAGAVIDAVSQSDREPYPWTVAAGVYPFDPSATKSSSAEFALTTTVEVLPQIGDPVTYTVTLKANGQRNNQIQIYILEGSLQISYGGEAQENVKPAS